MPSVRDSIKLMLEDMGVRDFSPENERFYISPSEASGAEWILEVTLDELEEHAEYLRDAAEYLGLGGKYSPGVALMSIHIEEEIATADEYEPKRLRLIKSFSVG